MKTRYYGKISYLLNQWVVEKLEPHVSIRLKSLFPKVHFATRPPFYFNDTLDFCEDMTWFMMRYPLEISKQDEKRLLKQKRLFEKNVAELETLLLPDTTFSKEEKENSWLQDGKSPRDYQIKTTKVLEKVKGIICGDDLGLGKTFTGMTVSLNLENTPTAIVVETHLPQQWLDNYMLFTKLDVHVIKSKKPYNLPKAHVYIFKYSNIAGWVDFFGTGFFKTAIYDEVQNLRTGTISDKGKGAKALSENAKLNMGMSHTPIFGYVGELWNIYDIIAPDFLGSRQEFAREWGDGSSFDENKIIIKDPKALGSYLRENHRFIKNTRKMVGRELLPVEKIVHEITHDETVVESYIDLAKKLSNTVLYSTDFKEVGNASRELDTVTRQMTGIAKASAVANFVKILLESGEPVILAGWHREVYRIWLEMLGDYKPLMFTGSESEKQKEENKQAFLRGESNLFIMSLRSGAGTDGLQARAKVIVFGEADWTSGVYEQLIGRLHRDGQDESVLAFFLFSTFGSDTVMRETLGLKASQARGITNPDDNPIKNMIDKNRIKNLAKNILESDKPTEVEVMPKKWEKNIVAMGVKMQKNGQKKTLIERLNLKKEGVEHV